MESLNSMFGGVFGKVSDNSEQKAPVVLGADSRELVNKVYTMLRGQVNVKLQPTQLGKYAITYKGEIIDKINGDSNEAKIEFINYCLDS